MSSITESLVGRSVAVTLDRASVGSDVRIRPVFAAILTALSGRFAIFTLRDGSEIIVAMGTIAEIQSVNEVA